MFGSEDGFNVAVALTSYDNEREWIIDPSYSELIFQAYSWGHDTEHHGFKVERKRLNSHVCSPEELGLTDDRQKAKFYPMSEHGRELVGLYHRKMLCLDAEDLLIYGDWNTRKGRQLNI